MGTFSNNAHNHHFALNNGVLNANAHIRQERAEIPPKDLELSGTVYVALSCAKSMSYSMRRKEFINYLLAALVLNFIEPAVDHLVGIM